MKSKFDNLFIAADHGGFELKEKLLSFFQENHVFFKVIDLGICKSSSVDYPDMAHQLVKRVLENSNNLGILICGTGIGMSIAANRFDGIRAALVYDDFTAKMAKAHNNANVLVLGGRITEFDVAKELINIWLTTEFEGGRHIPRLDKIDPGVSPSILYQ
ncbi:MAG: ribose 5-phosphate isomerase B [Candidatus Margulisiibacteriota bacterium]|jgi:ribose 5-phosphate isomerase B